MPKVKTRERKKKTYRRRDVGVDYDQELWNFFSGGYAGEAGLKSALGGQLDRLANQTGPSTGGMGDEWTNLIRMGGGPGSSLEAGKVHTALCQLLGQPPPPPKHKSISARVAYKAMCDEWPAYFVILKAYYTKVPHGSHQVLKLVYGDFANAALVCPMAQRYIQTWCTIQYNEDHAASEIARAKSIESYNKRKQEAEEELLRVKLVKAAGWPLRVRFLTKQIAAMKSPSQTDSTKSTKAKWSMDFEQNAMAALRELAERAEGNKDTPDRQDARSMQHAILEQCKGLWRAARMAYMNERRRVDREIRKKPDQDEKNELAAFKTSLMPMINAEVD